MALLEREAELAELEAFARRLRAAGEGGIVLVEGVAGIGKSELLRELVARARGQDGPQILTARGAELELELAFGAVRQLFAPVVTFDREERDRVLSGPASLAGAVLGLDAAAPSGDLVDPLYALSWLVTNLSEAAPLLIAVDDLHWLDAESGRFLAYLAQRVEGLPVLLAGTARPREPGAMASPLDTFRELATIVSPGVLSEAATAAVVGSGASAAEARRLTGGNPFLLAELSRALARAAPGVALGELHTRAVADSVLRRVRRISEAAVTVAEAVALFPAGAELSAVAAVTGLPTEAVATAADALIEADVFVADKARVEFLHPLMRAAVYERLGTFARRTGHAKAAAALRARGAEVELIAAHLLAGEPAGDPESVRILRAASDQALAAVAPRAAVRYMARALEEGAAQPDELRGLLLELGRWQRVIGDSAAPRTLERAFAASAGTPDHVRAAIELAATAYSHADSALVHRTVDAMGGVEMTADERLVLDMLQAEALWTEGHFEDSIRLIQRVPPDLPGDTPAQRMALGMAGAVHVLMASDPAQTIDMLRRSVGNEGTAAGPVAGLDLGDPLQWMLQVGAIDEAQALAEERMEHARAVGDEALFAATQNVTGWLLALRGDLQGSEAAYRNGLEHPALSPFMRAHLTLNVIGTIIQAGRLDQAERELDALGEGAFAHAQHIVALRRAEIARWRGDFAAALPTFEHDWGQNRFMGRDPHPGVVWLAPDYVDCLLAVGRRDEALDIARRLTDSSERLDVRHALIHHGSALARVTGDLADHERAVAAAAGTPYTWFEARARLEYGSALRRTGERVRAREQLRAVLDYCERSGVEHFAERARDELRVSGARLRTVEALSGADALTPAEARIARLAADGMSNKEIAQHLFVTVGTVQTTLVHVYRKLDIGGRKEIADALIA